jgi:hypothetical protein
MLQSMLAVKRVRAKLDSDFPNIKLVQQLNDAELALTRQHRDDDKVQRLYVMCERECISIYSLPFSLSHTHSQLEGKGNQWAYALPCGVLGMAYLPLWEYTTHLPRLGLISERNEILLDPMFIGICIFIAIGTGGICAV